MKLLQNATKNYKWLQGTIKLMTTSRQQDVQIRAENSIVTVETKPQAATREESCL